jgi:hypothetical protein
MNLQDSPDEIHRQIKEICEEPYPLTSNSVHLTFSCTEDARFGGEWLKHYTKIYRILNAAKGRKIAGCTYEKCAVDPNNPLGTIGEFKLHLEP